MEEHVSRNYRFTFVLRIHSDVELGVALVEVGIESCHRGAKH